MIIKYPGTTDKICSFVGSHLDVVPANPASWERNPFVLTVEGDTLYGRGTTDCLGHVALLTDLLCTLAENKPVLKTSIVVVFIVNEENSSFVGLGVDQLAKEGYLDALKSGPLFWIDAADSQVLIPNLSFSTPSCSTLRHFLLNWCSHRIVSMSSPRYTHPLLLNPNLFSTPMLSTALHRYGW